MLGEDVVGAAMLHGDAAGDQIGSGVGLELLGAGVVPAELGEVGQEWWSPLGLRNAGREAARPSREARSGCQQPTSRAGRGQEEAISVIVATSFVGDASSMPDEVSASSP